MITVLTYNIEFGKKLKDIYSWINTLEKKPQIICLQEFPENEIENLEKNKLFDKEINFFMKGLSRKEEIFGELTIIDSSKIKLIDTQYLDFGQDKIESIYKRRIIERSAIANTLEIRNKKISLANVHLTPVSLHGKRKKQLGKVIESVKEIESSIILGDFNYSSLLTHGGLINFMENSGYKLAGEKMVTNKYKYKIPQQLDYVFYKNLSIEKVEVFNIPFSDHYPVIVQFKI